MNIWLKCETCKYHEHTVSSGSFSMNGCPKCGPSDTRIILDKPAQQGQVEPVALPARKPVTAGLLSESNTHNRGWNAYRDAMEKLVPLYTHADPAEVERLRRDLHAAKVALKARARTFDTLRAQLAEAREDRNKIGDLYDEAERQLAEAHALLVKADYVVDHSRTIDKQAFNRGTQNVDHDLFRGLGNLLAQYDEALSASTEPSEERGISHGFEQSPNTCRHDERSGVWWMEGNVTRTGQECRDCGNVKEDPVASGCGYSIGDWECRPGGYLFDAGTGEGYDPQDCTYLCPHCRTQDFLESAKEEAESVSSYSGTGGSGTGLDIWRAAERNALDANRAAALHALVELGPVEALDGEEVVLCNTQSSPAEIDERAEFERAFVVQEGVFFSKERNEYRSMNGRTIEETDSIDLNLRLSGWQARAALERKP